MAEVECHQQLVARANVLRNRIDPLMSDTGTKHRKSLGVTVEQLCRLFNKNGPALRRLTLFETRTQKVIYDGNQFSVAISGDRVSLSGELNEKNRQITTLSICVNRRFQSDFWTLALPTILSILRILDKSFSDDELETLVAELGLFTTSAAHKHVNRNGFCFRWGVKSAQEFALDIFPSSVSPVENAP